MRKMFYIGVDLSGFFALAFPDEEGWVAFYFLRFLNNTENFLEKILL